LCLGVYGVWVGPFRQLGPWQKEIGPVVCYDFYSRRGGVPDAVHPPHTPDNLQSGRLQGSRQPLAALSSPSRSGPACHGMAGPSVSREDSVDGKIVHTEDAPARPEREREMRRGALRRPPAEAFPATSASASAACCCRYRIFGEVRTCVSVDSLRRFYENAHRRATGLTIARTRGRRSTLHRVRRG
jgi:hypothetical protein